ncbi:hypothetical protein N2152v2_005930 [Parachlorella kessleri]
MLITVVVSQLKPHNLQGLLLGSAVWLSASEAVVRLLDTLCLGNQDGGEATADYVRQALGLPEPAPPPQQQQERQMEGTALPQEGQPSPRRQRHNPADQGGGTHTATAEPPCEPDGERQAPPLPPPKQQQQQRRQQQHAQEEVTGQQEAGAAQQAPDPQQLGRQQQPDSRLSDARPKAVRLSLEEAFYMAYVLQVLLVHERQGATAEPQTDGATVPMTVEALWQRLQQLRSDFLLQYLAYHHFRSKGWIPRTGLQYGADMVLYQRHPSLIHSDYSVLIMPRSPGWRPPVSWHDIQVLNRLTGQVSKKLLLLYVQEEGPGPGAAGAGGGYSSPHCLARFSVREQLVRRWVPDSHRPA